MSERFVIVLEPMPARGMAPPIVRLRRAIKALGRAYLLKVVDIKTVKPEEGRGGS